MIVIDGAALVHMNPPKYSKTFGEYCESELGEKLRRVAVPVNQLDLVFYVYREDSLNGEAWEGRGNAVRVSVKDSTTIYSDFKKFLRHNNNKTELFLLIADKVPKFTQNTSTTAICTKLSEVTPNSKNNLSPLFPCNHEEADTRIFVHLSHAAQNGIKRALIKTVDTDVVAIALAHFLDREIDELWVEFGAGKKSDACQVMYMLNTWASKSVWHYSSGMFLQDVTLFLVSMVAGKNCLECVGSIS